MKTTQHYLPSFLRFIFNKLAGQTLIKMKQNLVQFSGGWFAVFKCDITKKDYIIVVRELPQEEALTFADFEREVGNG